MLAPSPILNDSKALTFAIEIEGEAFDSDDIVSIEVWNRVNRVPRARLVINDGSPATESFPLSAAETFLPGRNITIAAGYDNDIEKIFSGVIVKHALDIAPNAPPRLVVEMTDHALKMTLRRNSTVYKNKSDHALVSDLVSGNGLTVGSNEAPTAAQERIVQFHASDWDMLLTRAEVNGLLVSVDNGKISVTAPKASETAALSVEYGDSIVALDAAIDAAAQLKSAAIKSRSWSYTEQKVIEGAATDEDVTTPGDVTPDTLAAVFAIGSLLQQSAATLPQDALATWSSAELMRARLAKSCGRVRFQGSALAKLGKSIELAGVGPRFNGKAYISGVQHQISSNRWLTTVDFGLPAVWFVAEAAKIAAPAAAGQMPPVHGLQTGIVSQVAEDENGEHRVLVTLPLLGDSEGVWARLGGFYASKTFGAVFYPELGDEVVLGFMNEDPRGPIILGSVYSSTRAPAYPPTKENNKKAIVTRSKLEITFDDKDKIIEINTPGGHSIKLNDKTGEITINDSNSNSMKLAKDGITIDSASDITMKAKANISISAGANLDMKATANSSLKAVQISEQADAKHSVNVSGIAELKSSGLLTINGALVKIN